MEVCSPGPSSAQQSGPQGTCTGGEEDVATVETKEAKTNKKHLHCPTCKVTVNSSSQLEAHCSGMYYISSSMTCKKYFTWFVLHLTCDSVLRLAESGSKHKQMLDGQNSSQSQRRVRMTSSPRHTCRIKQRMGNKPRAVVGVASQPFHCELCQVSVNSETQLKQVGEHI